MSVLFLTRCPREKQWNGIVRRFYPVEGNVMAFAGYSVDLLCGMCQPDIKASTILTDIGHGAIIMALAISQPCAATVKGEQGCQNQARLHRHSR